MRILPEIDEALEFLITEEQRFKSFREKITSWPGIWRGYGPITKLYEWEKEKKNV
jgi:hypothetical protein